MTPEKGFTEEKVSSSDGLERQPKLRFPRFGEPWNPALLSDYFAKNTQKNSGGMIANVICNSAKQGLIPQREYFDKDIASSDNTNGYYIIETNDFVYNPRKSADAPYGPISSYKYPKAGIVSPLYLCFRAKQEINPLYFEWYFRSSAWHRYIYMSGDSGARHDRVSIKDDTFFAMPINIPSTKEQERISLFLDAIERRIETQRTLVETLKKYKRGLTNAIFRRELRFNADESKAPYPDWREVRFGDAFEYLSNNTLSRAELDECNGTIHNIHYGDILIKYGPCIDVKSSKIPFIKAGSPNQIQKMSLLRAGDIVLADTAEDDTVGKAVEIVNVDGQKVVAGLHTIPCRPHADWFAVGFLGYFINSSVFHNQLHPLIQGIKVSSISKSAIQDTIVLVPAMEEQQKIVSMLNGLEEKLAVAEMTLESLRQTKKGLLQQLFI